ncbi:MAG: nickel pincer cofactor biosynthesis protein LarB [Candidatus Eisenbacteria bacterium]
MQPKRIRDLLEEVARGACTVEQAVGRLRNWPIEDLGFAQVDHHRHLRRGVPEVIFAGGKEPAETERIAVALLEQGADLLVTRADEGTLARLQSRFPEGRANPRARTFVMAPEREGVGEVVVLSAGTSDIPVAEEAVETARAMGARVSAIYDVGVAGLNRLVPHLDSLHRANAIVAVAGMEGALPSVIGSLASCLVIAVPTSVGYGTSLGGLTALFGMLNSCASGLVVVNIDNGFGAGFAAGLVNRAIEQGRQGGPAEGK